MRIRWTNLALALGVVTLSVSAVQAAPKHHKKSTHKAAAHKVAKKAPSGAETSLVGITLFDNGLRVINLYGTPDLIQSANVATITSTGGGGAGGGFGAPPGSGGGGGGGRGGKRGGGGGQASSAEFSGPDEFGDEVLRQQGAGGAMPPGANAGPPPGAGGPPPGYGGPGGPGRGAPGGPGGPGGGAGGAGSGGGQTDAVVYTRWSYIRGASRYGFVFDKFNRVVQIEAIGIENPKVHTKRGIGFGNSFASLIKTYGPPDGYDIAGDSSLTVRYLVKAKVAFRLSRLAAKKPPVVTGIVIAAAKG